MGRLSIRVFGPYRALCTFGCRHRVDTFFLKMVRRVYDTNKRKGIVMNIFSLEYTVLLVAFLIVAYNMLRARGGDNRTGKNKY